MFMGLDFFKSLKTGWKIIFCDFNHERINEVQYLR